MIVCRAIGRNSALRNLRLHFSEEGGNKDHLIPQGLPCAHVTLMSKHMGDPVFQGRPVGVRPELRVQTIPRARPDDVWQLFMTCDSFNLRSSIKHVRMLGA